MDCSNIIRRRRANSFPGGISHAPPLTFPSLLYLQLIVGVCRTHWMLLRGRRVISSRPRTKNRFPLRHITLEISANNKEAGLSLIQNIREHSATSKQHAIYPVIVPRGKISSVGELNRFHRLPIIFDSTTVVQLVSAECCCATKACLDSRL